MGPAGLRRTNPGDLTTRNQRLRLPQPRTTQQCPPRSVRLIPDRQRLAAVAALGEREARLSAIQRLALVDAAAWWLSGLNGGEEFAYASTVA
jgi:hypothetical protein